MSNSLQLTETSPTPNNVIKQSLLPRGLLLSALALAMAWFALALQARAACQEGCLTNANTVLGDDALLNNTGSDNTAMGFEALLRNTTGGGNTANGAFALQINTTGSNNTATGNFALED